MNQILSFFYNMYSYKIISESNNRIIFLFENNYFMLKEIEKVNSFISFTQKVSFFHRIIKNKYNEIISFYDTKKYLLMYIKIKDDRILDLQDFKIISDYKINDSHFEKKNYYILWNKKNNYFKEYYGSDDYIANYINGIALNAIQYCKNINYNDITYGFSFSRLHNRMNIISFYDPTNIDYCPIVNGIAEYIKELYFFYNEVIDISGLFEFNLTINDYSLLISRLLFPTYLYDYYKNEEIYNIINKIKSFNNYINHLILEIKKRYNIVPLIKWLGD